VRPGNPLPLACEALVVGLPGIWMAGRWIMGTITPDVWLARTHAALAGVAVWLLGVHVIAYASRSFLLGLVAGTLVVSLGGTALFVRDRRRRAKAPPDGFSLPPSWWMLITALLSTAALAPAALLYNFHDEVFVTGHLSIVAEIQNGVYPPRNLTFPDFELQYHYGFNLLVAIVTALGRWPIDVAVDVITLACWAQAWCGLWVLGDRLFGRGHGAILAPVVLLGGGAQHLSPTALDAATPIGTHLLPLATSGGLWLNPPVTSYFFQHPWTLGIPLVILVLTVTLQRPGGRTTAAHYLVPGVLLVTLAITQFALFLGTVAALVVARFVSDGWRRRETWMFAASLGLAVALASRLGGFFAPKDGGGFGLAPQVWVTGDWASSLEWHARTFGVLLPVGLLGLWLLRRRPVFAALALGGLLVINTVRYEHSWDIAKFATVATLGLGFGTAAVISWLVRKGSPVAAKVAAAIVTMGAVATGVLFLATFALHPKGIPGVYYEQAPRMSGNEARVANWLRRNAKTDVVYVREDHMLAYACWGGIPQVWVDNATGFPFSRDRLARRQALTAHAQSSIDAYLAEHVRFMVLDGWDGALTDYVETWIAAGRAAERARSGPVRVVELLPGPR
jgi:hypothetical protein